jgi:hypothetical protein
MQRRGATVGCTWCAARLDAESQGVVRSISAQERNMSLPLRSRGLLGLAMIVCLAAWPAIGRAQGRPSGAAPRLWAELGLSAAAQAHRCVTCSGSAVGGVGATVVAGVTLPQGFGVGLLGRAFSQFSYESHLESRYVIALAQYTPPKVSFVTLNVGGGEGRHTSDEFLGTSNGSGPVFYTGAALRLPPRTGIAVSLTADVLQSIDGTPSSHPRLLSLGISLGASTSSPAP